MFLAKVEGEVVATKKDPNMSGRKLLLLRPQLVDEKDPTKFRPGAEHNRGRGQRRLRRRRAGFVLQGSSARLAPGMKEAPVDAVVVGIVDSVDVFGKEIFSAKV